MEKNYDETFLARWISSELSAEELSEFEKSPEYSEYKMISEGADRFIAPSYDRQLAWDSLREKTIGASETKKVRRLLPLWAYVAAAGVVVLLGYLFFFKQTSYTTPYGQTLAFDLPDDSEVNLNAGSSLDHKTFLWSQNRTVRLEGEALFQVQKGSTFTVETSQGTVKVVGTKFVVNDRENFFDVYCLEGKVSVQLAENIPMLLEAGSGIRYQNDNNFPYQFPQQDVSWLQGESSFINTPILIVIEELERQFGITVNSKSELRQGNFTGRFRHDDLEIALKTIFDAMQIKYTFDGDRTVTLQK